MTEKIYEDVNLAVLRHAGSSKRVLDVGCGSGSLGQAIREKGNYVVGVDISKSALDIAREKLDEVILADITKPESFSVGESSFDVIVFADILEHLEEPWGVLKRFKKYLKDTGKIIVSVPNITNWIIRLKILFGNFSYDEFGILDISHLRFFNLKTAKKLVEDSGYKIVVLDLTPDFVRSMATFLKFLHGIRNNPEEEYKFNKRLLTSPLFQVYRKFVFPIERFIAGSRKNLFAYQFVIVGVKCEGA